MSSKPPSRVVFAPRSRAALQRGVDKLANLIRPTLGPLPRWVALERTASRKDPPELLDDGATIARRFLALPDANESTGAMLLRHTVWRVYEKVGDGSATTAVLFQAIVREAARYVAAGYNAQRLRVGIDQGLAAVHKSLQQMAKPLEGEEQIAKAALALCQDPELARLLGEAYDIVGPDGYVQVNTHNRRGLDREYVEGIYWDASWFTPYFITDEVRQIVELDDPAVLVSDLEITKPEQILPIMEKVTKAGIKALAIIASNVSGDVLGLLVANQRAKVLGALAVKTPSYGADRIGIMADMAAITGGRVILDVAKERLEDATLEDLGRARRAWATGQYFGLMGGRGDPVALRQHIANVRVEIEKTADAREKDQVRKRLSKLMGGIGTIRVGGATEAEMNARKEVAERAAGALRTALQGGIVAGGGAALLACQEALAQMPLDGEEGYGVRILSRALEEPMRAIATNAGYEPAPIIARVRESPPGWGFDVRTGQIVDMLGAGIFDSLRILEAALDYAVSGAGVTFTTDVVVRRKKLLDSVNP
ncbi:MAG: chaperonin GroEL [Anaerolineae bacterium]|nr:chaperonin GroEL [Anaerolineae bacterium]